MFAMTRRCDVTGKGPMSGNNVSHANNHTRRKFNVNLQNASLYSEILGRSIKVRVSANGLRTIDHKGGIDAMLLKTAPSKLSDALRPYKALVMKKMDAKKAKSA
jgi:large subunit ribosomal protein L28